MELKGISRGGGRGISGAGGISGGRRFSGNWEDRMGISEVLEGWKMEFGRGKRMDDEFGTGEEDGWMDEIRLCAETVGVITRNRQDERSETGGRLGWKLSGRTG